MKLAPVMLEINRQGRTKQIEKDERGVANMISMGHVQVDRPQHCFDA